METKIEEIGNYYGCLSIQQDGDEYFWGIEDYDGIDYVNIPKSLYDEILKHFNNN